MLGLGFRAWGFQFSFEFRAEGSEWVWGLAWDQEEEGDPEKVLTNTVNDLVSQGLKDVKRPGLCFHNLYVSGFRVRV